MSETLRFGPMEIGNFSHAKINEARESWFFTVTTDAGKSITVYVSRTGRSLRVYKGNKELT